MNSAAQRNGAHFNSPARERTCLRARGFVDDGHRSGGILHPLEVALPAGEIREFYARLRPLIKPGS